MSLCKKFNKTKKIIKVHPLRSRCEVKNHHCIYFQHSIGVRKLTQIFSQTSMIIKLCSSFGTNTNKQETHTKRKSWVFIRKSSWSQMVAQTSVVKLLQLEYVNHSVHEDCFVCFWSSCFLLILSTAAVLTPECLTLENVSLLCLLTRKKSPWVIVAAR